MNDELNKLMMLSTNSDEYKIILNKILDNFDNLTAQELGMLSDVLKYKMDKEDDIHEQNSHSRLW